ncbi:MAG: sulfate adenylyltransferase [Candidatus Bathyarchaeota archaeon]|nr:MAG: sulfate adenylyltransferase [Candidatus Bathyarchaeota archaeon]
MPRPHGGKLVNRVFKEKDRKNAANVAAKLEKVEVSKALATDTENIAKGVFSPLQGFINQEELENVLNYKRLSNDLAWTIPIVLDVSEEKAKALKEGNDLALYFQNEPLALMHLEEKYKFNKEEFAEKTYGTLDMAHPGVTKTKNMGNILLAGKIDLINELKGPYDRYKLSPMETRFLFKEKGWRTIVGFQTRNPPHLGHEYVQKTALTFVDGVFINPVIGRKKKGDFKDEVILKAYDVLIENYYLKDRAVMSILPFEMRYAGPREAIFHAIVRKNFGCTHFIIGRDHAGVGNYYGPYEAQELFEEFPDLGIPPIFFKSFFYCKKCGGVTNEKACPHSEKEHIIFSGTKIRATFSKGEMPPKGLMRPEVSQVIAKYSNPFVE